MLRKESYKNKLQINSSFTRSGNESKKNVLRILLIQTRNSEFVNELGEQQKVLKIQ